MDERWLPVVGFEKSHKVGDLGRVRSLTRTLICGGQPRRYLGRVLTQTLREDGRLSVKLRRPGYRREMQVHRLVLEAFIGPPPPDMECCHKNGNPVDNRLSNLRWGTHSSNMFDKQAHGTDHQRNKTRCPRSHQLALPNLVAASFLENFRECLACDRASSMASYARERGRPYDMKAESDRYYVRIMHGT